MRFLNRITNDAHQRYFLTGNDDETITMTLRYLPSQESWFMDIAYNDFTVFGLRVVKSINLLRQWRNILPFGISCYSKDILDPVFIDDFQSERCALHLLDAEEVQILEDRLS